MSLALIWLLFGPSVRLERASGRLLELPMPSPVWKFIATTTMCAQGKEGSPLRAVYGGSRIARSDLLTGSPFRRSAVATLKHLELARSTYRAAGRAFGIRIRGKLHLGADVHAGHVE